MTLPGRLMCFGILFLSPEGGLCKWNESMKLHDGRKSPLLVLCRAGIFSSAPELPESKRKISFTYRCPSCMSWWRSTTRWHKLLLCPAPVEALSEWKPGEQEAELEGKKSILEDVAVTTILSWKGTAITLFGFLVY